MASVEHRPDRVLRNLLVVLELELRVDPDEVERAARQLLAELKELDIESVSLVTSDNIPHGAKGLDPLSLGALLITLSATGGVFTTVIETAREWLARHTAARRISVTIDGDTIVLDKASIQERNELIDAYIRHHELK